jgi:hypothetical protein
MGLEAQVGLALMSVMATGVQAIHQIPIVLAWQNNRNLGDD